MILVPKLFYSEEYLNLLRKIVGHSDSFYSYLFKFVKNVVGSYNFIFN